MPRNATIAALLCILSPFAATGETVVAARTIRAQAILTPGDLSLIAQDIAGAYVSFDEVVGQEARVVLYAGRPVRIDDVGPPAIVERNQIVTLVYRTGVLEIATEARALARAGVGDRLRVMNLTSRNTVTGWVMPDGSVSANPPAIPAATLPQM